MPLPSEKYCSLGWLLRSGWFREARLSQAIRGCGGGRQISGVLWCSPPALTASRHPSETGPALLVLTQLGRPRRPAQKAVQKGGSSDTNGMCEGSIQQQNDRQSGVYGSQGGVNESVT